MTNNKTLDDTAQAYSSSADNATEKDIEIKYGKLIDRLLDNTLAGHYLVGSWEGGDWIKQYEQLRKIAPPLEKTVQEGYEKALKKNNLREILVFWRALKEVTGYSPNASVAQKAYDKGEEFTEIYKISGISPEKEIVQKKYREWILTGNAKKYGFDWLKEFTKVEPIIVEEDVQKGYERALAKTQQDDMLDMIKLTNLKPSQKIMEEATAKGWIWVTHCLQEMGFEPSQEAIQKAYSATISNGALDDFGYLTLWFKDIKPELKDKDIQQGYKAILNKGLHSYVRGDKEELLEKLQKMQQETGVPSSAETIKQSYEGMCAEDFKGVKELQDILGVPLDEETVQKAFEHHLILTPENFWSRIPDIILKDMATISNETGIKPKPSKEIAAKFQEVYENILNFGSWKEFGIETREDIKDAFVKIQEITGIPLYKETIQNAIKKFETDGHHKELVSKYKKIEELLGQ